MSETKLLRHLVPLLGCAAWLGTRPAQAVDYYVAPLGSDGATGTLTAPFRTISRGVAAAMPGDTVHIRGGRYVGWQNQINPVRSGRADAWITFRAFEGEMPVLSPPSDAAEASAFEPFDDPAAEEEAAIAFIRVEGLVAYQWPTSGFSNGWEKHANNIEVRHCIADGSGINGFTFYEASGVTFENNIAAHSGNKAPSYSSGVNLYRVSGGPEVNVVRGNVSFENIDVCGDPVGGCDANSSTDGNGFILDEGNGLPGVPGVRFESNLAFRNGGSCLRVTLTPGAQLINNTCYNNGLDSGYDFTFGEIFFSDNTNSISNIVVRNNVAVGTNGQAVINNTNGANASVANNVFPANINAFRDPDGLNPDFRLSANAGALIDAGDGSATGAFDLGFDPGCVVRVEAPISGVPFWRHAVNYSYIQSIGGVAACFRPAARSVGGGPDMGAYESITSTGCQFHSDCEDGNRCSQDTCSDGGQCSSQAISDCCASDAECDDADACTADLCNLTTNRCEASPVEGCCPSGQCGSGIGGGGGVSLPSDTSNGAGGGSAAAPASAGATSSDPMQSLSPLNPASSGPRDDGGCALRAPRGSRGVTALPAFSLLGLLFLKRRATRRRRAGRGACSLGLAALVASGCGDEGAAPSTLPVFAAGDEPALPAGGTGSTSSGVSGAPNGSGGASADSPGSGGQAGMPPVNAEQPPPVVGSGPPSGPAQACAGALPPEDGLIIDFGTYDVATGSWGSDTQLTGGTSPYSCFDDGSCPATAALDLSSTPSGGMSFQALLPPGGYTGAVLWFGPCVNAAAFEGLQFLASGDLAGAVLFFKVQTNANYPVDVANQKGACTYRYESSKWSECVPPAAEIRAVAAEPAVFDLAWSQFGSGLPNTGVSPEGLVGLELQFQCQSATPCNVDLTLGTVLLTSPPFAF